MSVLVMLIMGCTQQEAQEPQPSAAQPDALAPTPEDASQPPPLAPDNGNASSFSATPQPIETYFSGRALEAVQRISQLAPQAIVEETATHAAGIASGESCKGSAPPEQTRLIDIDGDGVLEVISFHELSGCEFGSVIRLLSVYREDGQGELHPVLDTILSVVREERRPVLDIAGGKITLAGEPDGFGGVSDPEVIDVPTLESPAQ